MKKWLDRVLPYFPTAFINEAGELIIEPKNNVYFRLDNVTSRAVFDCKMLEYVSRPAHNHWTLYWQRWFLRGINSYFGQNWSRENMEKIYTYLGNGINRSLCKRFIGSGFDLELLMDEPIKPERGGE